MHKRLVFVAAILGLLVLTRAGALAGTRLVLASTTSTQNTGLFDVLLPAYYKWTKLKDIRVDVVAVGTGKALEIARRGDADILLVHDPEKEEAFALEGYGVDRRQVMHNDFVIVGPKSDPAGVKDEKSARDAFKKISSSQVLFVSRGDESGTHAKEKAVWKLAGVEVKNMKGYLSVGQGMEAALRIADEKGAYLLSDRATYLALAPTLKRDTLLFSGDPALYNQYSVMAVNPGKFPHVHYREARDFMDFVTGTAGQTLIGRYKDKFGNPLFVPDAK